MLSDRFVAAVRDAAQITDVFLAEKLKKTGQRDEWVTVCPYHDDHDPSLTVNTSKNVCHCHVCGAGGDTIDALRLLPENRSWTFTEAIEHLARLHNIPVEHDDSAAAEQSMAAAEHRRELVAKNEQLQEQWHEDLINQAPMQFWDYLESRGILAAVDDWKIGAGRLKTWWDQRRLVIPMHDHRGDVVAFVARDLDWVKGKQPGKWMNSRNEPGIYEKSRHLFALHRVIRNSRKHAEVLVVEGQLDAIACHVNGLTNTVGIGGTALTLDHVQQIKKTTGMQKVVLALDGDKAGQESMDRMLNELLPLLVRDQLDLHLLTLPDDKDPADLGAEMGPLVATAPIWFEWWWNREIGPTDNDDPAAIQQANRKVKVMLNRLPEGAAFTYIKNRAKTDLHYRPRVRPQELIKFVTREECYFAEHRALRLALHHQGARGCLAEAPLQSEKLQELQTLLLMLRDYGTPEDLLIPTMVRMVNRAGDKALRDEMRSLAAPIPEIGHAMRRVDPISEMSFLMERLESCTTSHNGSVA